MIYHLIGGPQHGKPVNLLHEVSSVDFVPIPGICAEMCEENMEPSNKTLDTIRYTLRELTPSNQREIYKCYALITLSDEEVVRMIRGGR